LPAEFSPGSGGLGMQIVQALVGGELRGRIAWSRPPGGGTQVSIDATLRRSSSESTPAPVRQSAAAD
jgi:two-component system, sensor histidine kinase PdtaS